MSIFKNISLFGRKIIFFNSHFPTLDKHHLTAVFLSLSRVYSGKCENLSGSSIFSLIPQMKIFKQFQSQSKGGRELFYMENRWDLIRYGSSSKYGFVYVIFIFLSK